MTALFTIVSANYIAFAATLMQSVRTFHPEIARYIVLSDAAHEFDGLDVAAEIVPCEELGVALIANMQLWYSVIEFNTAVKPFAFRYLFDARGFDTVIYLDPDIELHSPLQAVFDGLATNSLVLTPHMLKPLQDGKHPSDLSIMKSGVYNLGFAAIRDDADGRGLVDWWCDRLFAHCRVDVPGNMFTDQRWMDLAPAFVPRTLLLRHPGYNVAYWNLVQHQVERGDDGTWRVDGEPLAFFHFSGIKPDDPSVFSVHQDRFTVDTLGPVALLCDEYRARVLANGWRTFRSIPYAYGVFADGRPILDSMRRWVLDAVDSGLLPKDRPLALGSDFFDAADEAPFTGGRLTRFAHQFWRDRPDLRAAFDLQHPTGLEGYIAWFCDGPAEREGVPAGLVQAARVLRDRNEGALAAPAAIPWSPLATQSWPGPARDALQWLQGDLTCVPHGGELHIQRQAALLWERRLDLQHFFPLTNAQGFEDYHLWTLTDGMRERVIHADLFTDDYLTWLQAPSPLTRQYGDIPITNAMELTRRSEHARSGLLAWPLFPQDFAARLEQAFWFAYRAPHEFGWPPAMTASVQAYFTVASGPTAYGFPMPRGVLALHAMREDIRRSFKLDTEAVRWAYLCWVLAQGAREYGVDVLQLCPGIAEFLAKPVPSHPVLSRLALFAYSQREDLRSAYNLDSRMGLAGMQRWVREDLEQWLASIGLSRLVAAPAPPGTAAIPNPLHAFVALAGDWTVASGIGEDLRTAVGALDAIGFTDYVIVDLPSKSVITADRARVQSGRAVRVTWTVMFHNADTALDDWLTLRRMRVTGERIAGHWLWELERMPARWIHAFSFCDEIWASSRFVADIFEAEARRPVRLLHHAVSVPQPAPYTRRDLGVADGLTLFLFMFDVASYTARKNPAAVIRAFRQAFPEGTETACLLIKTQNASLQPALWAELEAEAGDPRVMLRDLKLSRAELTGLVASADAFVSLHRSEGFGRGPAEAMLLGIPVILTGYSGTADFADDSCACIVGYTMVPVQPGQYPGVEGQSWAEPDVAEAAAHMRWVHQEPAAAKAMGLRGQQRVATMLDSAKIGADMMALLRSPALA